MQIEEAKKEFKIIIDTVRGIFKLDVQEDDEDIYEIDGRQFLAIETALNYIETMQSEFDRLEGIEDNTAMLKYELEKKDKAIDEMAEYIVPLDIDEDICKDIEHCTDENNNTYKLCKDCIKEYFYKKVSDNK